MKDNLAEMRKNGEYTYADYLNWEDEIRHEFILSPSSDSRGCVTKINKYKKTGVTRMTIQLF